MQTLEQAPWIPYLVINPDTRERPIKDDAPEEIKKLYSEYLSNLELQKANNQPIAK